MSVQQGFVDYRDAGDRTKDSFSIVKKVRMIARSWKNVRNHKEIQVQTQDDINNLTHGNFFYKHRWFQGRKGDSTEGQTIIHGRLDVLQISWIIGLMKERPGQRVNNLQMEDILWCLLKGQVGISLHTKITQIDWWPEYAGSHRAWSLRYFDGGEVAVTYNQREKWGFPSVYWTIAHRDLCFQRFAQHIDHMISAVSASLTLPTPLLCIIKEYGGIAPYLYHYLHVLLRAMRGDCAFSPDQLQKQLEKWRGKLSEESTNMEMHGLCL